MAGERAAGVETFYIFNEAPESVHIKYFLVCDIGRWRSQ